MKKSLISTLIILLVLLVSLTTITGCAGSTTAAITDDLILNAVKEVAPLFETTASRAATWDNGGPIYELYGVLKGDGMPVGYFNLYGLMADADDYFTDLATDSTAITLQQVDPPTGVTLGHTAANSQYNLYRSYEGTGTDAGKSSKTYGRVDGTKFYMLVAMQNTAAGENSKHVIQGVYDETSGDIDIRMFYANKPTGGWEKGYAFVSGNTATHQFTLRVLRDGFAYDHNMVGYGLSQGTGYFLMKLANNAMVMTNAAYYEFNAASLGITALQAMDDAGSATVPANTTDYETALNAVTPLESSSLPDNTALEALNVFTGVSHN